MVIIFSILAIGIGILLCKYGIGFISGGIMGILTGLGLKEDEGDSDE